MGQIPMQEGDLFLNLDPDLVLKRYPSTNPFSVTWSSSEKFKLLKGK